MKRVTINISIVLAPGLGIIVPLILLWVWGGGSTLAIAGRSEALTPPVTELRVCPSGCTYTSIQAAVDDANDGDLIKVSTGVYTGVNNYGGLSQMVYISKTVVIRGGYTAAFTDPPDPKANPTTLDAQGQGRVLFITGMVSPTVEGLRVVCLPGIVYYQEACLVTQQGTQVSGGSFYGGWAEIVVAQGLDPIH